MTRIERLKLLASAIAGDFKTLRLKLGNTDELVTDDKTSAVNAINEVAGSSKEIKDAMKQFSENLGFDKEITKVNNVSVNPFEMLVPFIKDKLAEEGITNVDTEKNTQNCFFAFFDDTIKIQYGSNFSKNKYGIKLKQNAYDKFVKFDVSANNVINASLPQEINTSQDIELDIYGILGHYMSDYKIMPYTKYIKQLNIPSDRIVIVNSLEEHEGRSYSSSSDDILVLVKINLDELSDMTDSIQKLFKLQNGKNITQYSYGFVNNNLTKYYDFTTRQWLPLENLISSDMQYQIKLLDLKVPVKPYEIAYINNGYFSHTNNLTKINILPENSDALNKVNNLKNDIYSVILNPDLTKYYNIITKQWNELTPALQNKYNYLNSANSVNENINASINQDNPYIRNNTNATTLESDNNSKYILVVNKDKITNLELVENSTLYSPNVTTSMIVDKTLNYVLNKNTRTWKQISNEQSQKIKDKITIDFNLTINDKTDSQNIKCRTHTNEIDKSNNKNILIYDKNNSDLEDISSVDYSIYDGNIVVDKTYTYYLNPYTSVWYELPTEVKTKLITFINEQYKTIFNSLKAKGNDLSIVDVEQELTDINYDTLYLVKNKQHIAFTPNNDSMYPFYKRSIIFTSDLAEYFNIPTQEWKQVNAYDSNSIDVNFIVSAIANKKLFYINNARDSVIINTENLNEIKNLIIDKKAIKNDSNQNLIYKDTIDLTKVEYYGASEAEQGNRDFAVKILEKMPNLKVVCLNKNISQVAKQLEDKNIIIITAANGDGYNTYGIYYKNRFYNISKDDSLFKNNLIKIYEEHL